MSWALPIYQSVALSEFLQQTLSQLSPASVCISGADGKSIWIETRTALDAATLPAMAQTCQQYLNLNDSQIAICNDTYTGGTDLSHVTLVVGLGQLLAGKADFILSARIALEPLWVESGKINDEGVRIPPTPVGTLRSPNWDLLAMIGSAPLSPRGFDHGIRELVDGLISVHATLQRALGDKNGVFHKTCGKDFLADSVRMFRKQVGHLALGESFTNSRLSSGEFIKLRLKVEDEKILFDFSGTDSSPTLNLTELMTLSICFAAIQETLGHKVVCNSGAFDSLVVSAPAKTLLNAKAPAGTWRGAHEGAPQLFEFLVSHLKKINKIQSPAPIAAHPGFIELVSEAGSFFYTLDHGLTSSPSTTDSEGTLPWKLSAEEIEAKFPLRFSEFGERRDSGENGQARGGNRRALAFEALAPVKVRWNFTTISNDAAVTDLQPTVTIADQAQKLKGEARLSAGQTISFASAAGRAVGVVKTEDETV